jgi:type IV pilus assembly protein PilE
VTRTKASIRVSGFTLVELVIVMVIVAILAAIAIPSYRSQIRKSRRTDAKTVVLDLAAREEKYFSLNNSYTSSPVSLGYGTATSFPQNVSNGYYQVYVCAASTAGSTSTTTGCTAATTATGTSYVVAAIPVTGTTQASDSSCQYFAVDNTGTQFASSTAGIGTDTTTTCWQ